MTKLKDDLEKLHNELTKKYSVEVAPKVEREVLFGGKKVGIEERLATEARKDITLNMILSYLSKLESQGYKNLVFKLLGNGRGSVEGYDGKVFVAFNNIKGLEKILDN